MTAVVAAAVCGNTLVIVSVLRFARLRIVANSFLVSRQAAAPAASVRFALGLVPRLAGGRRPARRRARDAVQRAAADRRTLAVLSRSELSMGLFRVTQPNQTHYK